MRGWILEKSGYEEGAFADNGNRFLIGNGYMGIRGALEEDGKDKLAAVNLAGIYDKVGELWREPLNAPNPFYTFIEYRGAPLTAADGRLREHKQQLDYQHGLAGRKSVWDLEEGKLSLECERFLSLSNGHIAALSYSISSESDIELTLFSGIDADVWDINGPHYEGIDFSFMDGILSCEASTRGRRAVVGVSRRDFIEAPGEISKTPLCVGQSYALKLRAGERLRLVSLCSVFTSNDCPNPALEAREGLLSLSETDYEALKSESAACWEDVWRCSEVEIDGDEEAERALNYSIYHLNCIAPRDGGSVSIAARGLSGQTYKGAVFWDTEMFILDYFLMTQPDIARSLIKYRIETLPGALEKAREYGFEGAFYAWESQEGGIDACSDFNVTDVFTGRPVRTYFRDKQVHISSAIAWGIKSYASCAGDRQILFEGGAKTVLECALFYRSLLLRRINQEKYELHDVIGPDEYHERVNNNAYTNRMARFVFDYALELLNDEEVAGRLQAEYPIEIVIEQLIDCRDNIYLPQPNSDGIIEQFDGYFKLEDASLETLRSRLKDPREYWGGGQGVASDTQIIKQADTIAMLELFHKEYEPELIRKNWDYYEPRTEHGSSLSACMYAMSACRFGEANRAYPFFMKSATAEIRGGGKQWAGLVYIGGTHPAAAGGAWKTLAYGFAGLEISGGEIRLAPCLPSRWKSLSFRFCHGGRLLRAKIADGQAEIEQLA